MVQYYFLDFKSCNVFFFNDAIGLIVVLCGCIVLCEGFFVCFVLYELCRVCIYVCKQVHLEDICFVMQ